MDVQDTRAREVTSPVMVEPGGRVRGGSLRYRMAVLVVLVVPLFGVSCLLAVPRGVEIANTDMSADPIARTFAQTTYLDNPMLDMELTGATASARGVKLIKTEIIDSHGRVTMPGSAVPLAMGATVGIEMLFRVTDCQNPTYGPIPVLVHLRRLWLNGTETVTDHGQLFPDAGAACGMYRPATPPVRPRRVGLETLLMKYPMRLCNCPPPP